MTAWWLHFSGRRGTQTRIASTMWPSFPPRSWAFSSSENKDHIKETTEDQKGTQRRTSRKKASCQNSAETVALNRVMRRRVHESIGLHCDWQSSTCMIDKYNSVIVAHLTLYQESLFRLDNAEPPEETRSSQPTDPRSRSAVLSSGLRWMPSRHPTGLW